MHIITNLPFIGKKYKVISGCFEGFIGKCVSYDLEHDTPVILQDEQWNSKAVRLYEIEPIRNNDETDISNLEKN